VDSNAGEVAAVNELDLQPNQRGVEDESLKTIAIALAPPSRDRIEKVLAEAGEPLSQK
jgi:hypothetical protein